jgi:hypothetical protein
MERKMRSYHLVNIFKWLEEQEEEVKILREQVFSALMKILEKFHQLMNIKR